jgi:hypothetical protein
MPGPTRKVLSSILVPILVVCLGAVAVFVSRRSQAGQAPDTGPALAVPGWVLSPGPITAGTKTTLEDAIAEAPFQILRPNDPLASDHSLTAVWVRAGPAALVTLQYRSGILIKVQEYQGKDPATNYAAVQKDFENAYVTTIGREPALILRGNVPGMAPSMFITINGIQVEIQGGSGPFTADAIIRIAASMPQNTPNPSGG